jgi:hypothetical protein
MKRLLAHWLIAMFVMVGVLSARPALAAPACAEGQTAMATQHAAAEAQCPLCPQRSSNPTPCCSVTACCGAVATGMRVGANAAIDPATPLFLYSGYFGRLPPAPLRRPPRSAAVV